MNTFIFIFAKFILQSAYKIESIDASEQIRTFQKSIPGTCVCECDAPAHTWVTNLVFILINTSLLLVLLIFGWKKFYC